MKSTPDSIIQSMNTRALKGMVKASYIDQADPIETEEVVDEPNLVTHTPDPNVVEVIQHEDSDDEDELQEVVEPDEVEEADPLVDPVDPVDEPNVDTIQSEIEEEVEVVPVQPTRRSARANAGMSSKYYSIEK